MSTRNDRRSGFALTDCVALVLSAAILLLLGIACLEQSRRHARLDEDLGHLRRLAAATDAYASDNADLIWGFSWEAGGTYEMLGLDGEIEVVTPSSTGEASSLQAVHLIRLLDDRIGGDGMPELNNWIPQIYYSHLPLQDYLGTGIPQRVVVSAADTRRLNWQDDPINKFDEGFWLPLQPDPSAHSRRWPYSSSFQQTAGAWDLYQSDFRARAEIARISQAGSHYAYAIPQRARFGQRPLSDVDHPAGKVHLYDTHQRHFGERTPFFGLEEARIPLLFFDGAASVRQTADSNHGWRPNHETFPCVLFKYEPSAWELPTVSGGAIDYVHGFYRWTRGGLKGLDFGGAALDTGQSGDCFP